MDGWMDGWMSVVDAGVSDVRKNPRSEYGVRTLIVHRMAGGFHHSHMRCDEVKREDGRTVDRLLSGHELAR